MATTKRQQIVDALQTLIAATSGLTGCTVWQLMPEEKDQLPAAVIEDGESTPTALAGGVTQHSLTVDIDIAVVGTESDPADQLARSLAGDVLAQFGTDPTLGDLLTGSRQSGLSLGVNSKNVRLGLGRLRLVLEYETSRFEI